MKRVNGTGSVFWNAARNRWIIKITVPGTSQIVSRTVTETTDPGPRGQQIADVTPRMSSQARDALNRRNRLADA